MPADQGNAKPEQTDYEDIPVDELIRIAREFTRRITNQDRQRLGLDLRESGHSRSLRITAPITLQQFFSGEIDLDSDLSRRFMNAPLLSYFRLLTESGEASTRQATAIVCSNDDAAIMTVDAHTIRGQEAALEFTFTLQSTLALRFRLPSLMATDRSRWLELMRRANGIAFLWTRERWEQPYLIFVVREYFARLYAFSPHGFEAAVRMTPDMVIALVDWLEGLWFPGRRAQSEAAEMADAMRPVIENRPTWAGHPASLEQAYPPRVTDTPEEQWQDQPPPPEFDDRPPEPPEAPLTDETDLSADDLDW